MSVEPALPAPQNALTTFFAHHLWSNLRVFEACLALTPDQLAYTAPGTYGSIQATLVHLVRSEERYLTLLRGQDLTQLVSPTPTTPLADLQTRIQQSGAALLQLAASFDARAQVRVGEGEQVEWLPASVFLLQAIYHAHEHRTQINTLLGQLGITTPGLSAWDYYDEEMLPQLQ
jgi:uncharacterized damage-inducible protein DinB